MENLWKLAHDAPRSGYLADDDLPETGGLAALLIRSLASGSQMEMDVRFIAASANVPTSGSGRYTQVEALSRARNDLRDLADGWLADVGVCTLFAKTLTVMTVAPALSEQDLQKQRAADEEICLLLPAWAGATHIRLRIRPSDGPQRLAQSLMQAGWTAAVASAARRRADLESWRGAQETIARLLERSRGGVVAEIMKPFTTPTWRTRSRELLNDPWIYVSGGRDPHMPELVSEASVRALFSAPVTGGGGTLLASDVHGLFSGCPSGFLSPKQWPGIANVFQELAHREHISTSQFHFMTEAFRTRLRIARRLRHTLSLIATTSGVTDCAFIRGDGAAFLMGRNKRWDVERAASYVRDLGALPFGVGATTIRDGESVNDALARAECAVGLTKIAPPSSSNHAFVHFDDPMSAMMKTRIWAAQEKIQHHPYSSLPKAIRGLVPYSDLLQELK